MKITIQEAFLLIFLILASLCCWGVFFWAIDRAFAHDIDHLSRKLGVNFRKSDGTLPVEDQVVPNEPLSWDGVFYEGQPTNSCLENPERFRGTGKSMKELRKDFWHSRRNLVNMITLLAGMVNRNVAYATAAGIPDAKIPFYNYDPFHKCSEPYYPYLPANFAALAKSWGLPLFWCDGLEVRYDYFLQAQREHPEHSYRVGFPARAESAFNYYDRIPADPIADACAWWKDGKITFQHALSYAEAHCDAGMAHFNSLKVRVLYLWDLERLKGYRR